MSLMSDFDIKQSKCIQQMVSVHFYTKKYLLIAEEIADQGELFLQPLKEHRDAFDHLMRCYSISFITNEISEENKDKYITKNLDKAYGHVYRAFFDTADWLTYLLRKWIRTKLLSIGEEECKKKLNNYNDIKTLINDIPLKIASLRQSKDVGKSFDSNDDDNIISEINEYVDILDSLIELRKNIIMQIGL